MSAKYRTREELGYQRDNALQDYLNLEPFRYDPNGDALYHHYRDRYVELGKQAMQDTMGQAAALTGGYGSSYAQNVGQQAYQSYLQQLGDVVPELYKLAYDRYQNQSDRLYRIYESWAQLEQEAADREQQNRELALREAAAKKTTGQTETGAPAGDYYAWLSYHQGRGQRSATNDPTMNTKYDNGKVSTGNILTMQRVLGMPETGMWTDSDRLRAGKLSADDAWAAYQKGQLQNRTSPGLGDMGLPNDDVRSMERVLGLREDGFWSDEDIEAAGGMSEAVAWEAYKRGLLQLRR